jgi:hypothetical protein
MANEAGKPITGMLMMDRSIVLSQRWPYRYYSEGRTEAEKATEQKSNR